MRGVLKALVAVDMQLPGDPFLLLGIADGGKHESHGLMGSGFVGDKAAVKEATDD